MNNFFLVLRVGGLSDEFTAENHKYVFLVHPVVETSSNGLDGIALPST